MYLFPGSSNKGNSGAIYYACRAGAAQVPSCRASYQVDAESSKSPNLQLVHEAGDLGSPNLQLVHEDDGDLGIGWLQQVHVS